MVHSSPSFAKMISHLGTWGDFLLFCENPGRHGLGTGKMYEAHRLHGTSGERLSQATESSVCSEEICLRTSLRACELALQIINFDLPEYQ